MIKNFKSKLMSIYKEPMEIQKTILEKTLDDWMEETSQVDDILVMGIKSLSIRF